MNITNDYEKTGSNTTNYYLTIFWSIIIYLLYLELNPKIGGIWLRRGELNQLRITVSGLKDFILFPFKEIKMWYPGMWDMNAFISVPLLTGLILLFKQYINK